MESLLIGALPIFLVVFVIASYNERSFIEGLITTLGVILGTIFVTGSIFWMIFWWGI